MKQQNPTYINILGTSYEYTIADKRNEQTLFLSGCAGYCDVHKKKIAINSSLNENRKQEAIRHEIIHAFFYESGLDTYNGDEKLVEWIAMQFPKLLKLFWKQDVIDNPF